MKTRLHAPITWLILVVVLVSTLLAAACSSPAQAPAPAPTSSQAPAPSASPAGQTTPTATSKAPVPTSSAKPITLRLSTSFPGTSSVDAALKWWINDIQTRTNNKVAIQVYWGGTLASQAETLNAVKSGVADMGYTTWSYFPDKFPISYLLTNTVYSLVDYPYNPMAGWKALQKIRTEIPDLDQEYEKQQVELVSDIFGTEIQGMITKKQVKTLDDMKGLKIRVAAGINGDLYRAVGIVPVFIASGEAFDALDKGTITASHGGLELIFRYKWNEAAKFYIDGYRSASNPQYNVVCNLDVWKGLPADVQKAIKDASAGWLEAYENILATNLQTYKKTFLAQGMVMSTLSNSDSDKWMGMMNVSALKTQAAADAVKYGASDATVKKIIQRYIDLEPEYIKSYPNKF